MRLVLKICGIVVAFVLLTVLTQVGGLVYLLAQVSYRRADQKNRKPWTMFGMQTAWFLLLYVWVTWLVVPVLAKPLGRVPLPFKETKHLRPLNRLSWLLNRNYVTPELREAVYEVAQFMSKEHPGTVINYLDANFPFFNGFPLLPHLSHSDGKKLDLSFCYRTSPEERETNEAPSFIGYGICEEPKEGEVNAPEKCAQKSHWQYDALRWFYPQGNKANFVFDAVRTKSLIQAFANNEAIGKIFIEPHLKTRLKLSSAKIRFHGCQSVRHDDHIHVQLK